MVEMGGEEFTLSRAIRLYILVDKDKVEKTIAAGQLG